MQSTLFSHPEVQSDQQFTMQNGKLLKIRVTPNAPVQIKRGSMVAYQGGIQFQAAATGGLGKMLKKAVTGEGQDMALAQGNGELFVADLGQDIHLVYLENEGISCNGAHVLAFDAGIQWNIERVQGMGFMAGGFFNMALHGTGWVALLSEGQPVVLNTAEAPTFADPDAVICWSSGLQTAFNRDTSGGLKSFVRGGSGETFQMAFHGQGWVIVQPSEGVIKAIASQVGAQSGGGSGGGLGGLLNG